MQLPQIRISKTPEMSAILSYFKQRYRLMSEAEIIKMVLSDFYYSNKQTDDIPTGEEMKSLFLSGAGVVQDGPSKKEVIDWWNTNKNSIRKKIKK